MDTASLQMTASFGSSVNVSHLADCLDCQHYRTEWCGWRRLPCMRRSFLLYLKYQKQLLFDHNCVHFDFSQSLRRFMLWKRGLVLQAAYWLDGGQDALPRQVIFQGSRIFSTSSISSFWGTGGGLFWSTSYLGSLRGESHSHSIVRSLYLLTHRHYRNLATCTLCSQVPWIWLGAFHMLKIHWLSFLLSLKKGKKENIKSKYAILLCYFDIVCVEYFPVNQLMEFLKTGLPPQPDQREFPPHFCLGLCDVTGLVVTHRTVSLINIRFSQLHDWQWRLYR